MTKYEVWNVTIEGKLAGLPHKAHADFITFKTKKEAEEWKFKYCEERQILNNFAPDNRMVYEVIEIKD